MYSVFFKTGRILYAYGSFDVSIRHARENGCRARGGEVAQGFILTTQDVDRQKLKADLESVPAVTGGGPWTKTLDVTLEEEDVVLLQVGDSDLRHAFLRSSTHGRVVHFFEGYKLSQYACE